MPTIDGGHIFLTLLLPVKRGEVVANGHASTHSHRLREELALLPTAAQSPVCCDSGFESPFARCLRTHFLRLVVIDQPMFNGRDPSDPLRNILPGGRDPLVHQKFDTLSGAWLLLSADIDRRPDEPDQGIASWAGHLWRVSGDEMRAIFGHCHGFEAVTSAGAFADWLKRGQLPTTMSFNDYWPGRPPLTGETIGRLAGGGLAVAAGLFALGWALAAPSGLGWLLLAILALAGGVAAVLARLWRLGGRAFPPAPDSDLPAVLKALHVQQRFAFFAEAMQGLDPAARFASFAAFASDVRPSDVQAPTQPPGVIRSDGVEPALHTLTGEAEMVL